MIPPWAIAQWGKQVNLTGETDCGTQLLGTGTQAASTDCSMACGGNASEACGGPNRLNLFSSQTAPPVVNPGPPGWTSLGCYNDSVNARTLPNTVATAGGQNAMTVALCLSACQQAGYSLAGVEYANECCKFPDRPGMS